MLYGGREVNELLEVRDVLIGCKSNNPWKLSDGFLEIPEISSFQHSD